MAVFIAAGFTACTSENTYTIDPKLVAGKWYVELQQKGTYGEGANAFDFDKVAIYGNLNADGTGTWYALFFNPYGNLIDTGDVFFGAGSQYNPTADGATVTLQDCSLGHEDVHKPALNCLGSANIILVGTSHLTGGKLGAGIGGGNAKDYRDCGDIVIKSGRVNAFGQLRSAGIGTGQGGSCGNITIEGGEVYAQGGADAAGIGGGYLGTCKEINLNGGKVDVQGGDRYPAVGCGPEEGCYCDTIRVYGGDISCIAGKDSPNAMGCTDMSKGLCEAVLISYKIKSLYMKGQNKKARQVYELFDNDYVFASYLPMKDYWWLMFVKFDEGADEVSKGIHYIVTSDRSVRIIPQEDVENYIEVEPRTGFII